MMLRRFAMLIPLALTLGLNASQASVKDTETFTLQNGMKVIVKPDHRAPTVAHMVWYKAGSVDEYNGTTGVAHVLEHMMFKGTKKLAPGEFSKRVAALGGRENAFTGKDYTAYFQQIQKQHLPAVMSLEADRMANLRLSDDEFRKEIQVVMEERRLRTEDQPTGLLYESLMAAMFLASPQRAPIIGWMGDLQAMTADDARLWYRRWYAPNNAVLIVAGDVDPAKLRPLVEQTYGRILPKPLPDRKPQPEPLMRGAKRLTVKAPAENPVVMIAWPAPSLLDVEKDQDVYALAVLSAILDGYDNARLTKALVKDQRIADDVGASYDMTNRGPAVFMLTGQAATGKAIAEVESALLQEVQRLIKDGITEPELQRVKAQLISSQIYKRDSLFGQAMEIAQFEMVGLDHRSIPRVIEKLQVVSTEDVIKAAQRYLQADQSTTAILEPLPMTEAKKPARGFSHGLPNQ